MGAIVSSRNFLCNLLSKSLSGEKVTGSSCGVMVGSSGFPPCMLDYFSILGTLMRWASFFLVFFSRLPLLCLASLPEAAILLTMAGSQNYRSPSIEQEGQLRSP